MLQDELLEIVKVKTDHYNQRFNTEYKRNLADTFDEHGIQPINKDLMNLPFEDSGKRIITQFQENIRKLRDFLTRVDKDMAATFNNEGNMEEDAEYDPQGEFANVRSVSQLKHLFKNYK